MAVGIDPFRDKEGGDPVVEGLAIRIDEFDQDFMRPSAKTATYRHEWQQQRGVWSPQ